MKRRIFVDMDGTLAEWRNIEDTAVLYEKGYYESLKPNELLLQEIQNLIRKGEDVYILSSFLDDSEYALEEKKIWLKRYLPELSDEKKIFVKYGDIKATYIPNGIGIDDYLIDDYTKNLLEWKDAGGTGIKFLNGINHTRGTWDGMKLENNENLSENLDIFLSYSYNYPEKFNEKYTETYLKFLTAVDKFKSSINRPLNELLTAEIEMKDAKMDFLKEREKLLENFDITEKSRWNDEGDIIIHYQVSLKNGKVIHEGYTFVDPASQDINEEIVINNILNSDISDRIDITKVSNELHSFVKDILSIDHEGSVRIYEEDLLDSWNMDSPSLANKMKEVEHELNELGISSSVDIYYTGMGHINYIDVNPSIITAFDFTKEYNPEREKKVFNYTINGKDVRCEIEFNEQMGGYAVMGYTIDKETNIPDKIQQILTKEELAFIQGKLSSDINNLFNEQFKNSKEIDLDITDEMF